MTEHSYQIIRDQAQLLTNEAHRTDSNIVKFYWFPDTTEVRLVEVATDMLPSRDASVMPFYFPPAPAHKMPAPSGVALIQTGEDFQLSLPDGWGSWNSAVELSPQLPDDVE